MENPKKSKDNPSKTEMDFGMVDLGGQEAEGEKSLGVDRAPQSAAKPASPPKAPAAAPRPQSAAAPLPTGEASEIPQARPASRYEPLIVSLPLRPLISAQALKIILLVLIIAGALGGAVYGYLKWRERVNEQEIAEKQNLDQRSLDSLREKVIRKESVR